MISRALRGVPPAVLGLLEVGVAWDLFSIADRGWIAGLALAFGANLLLLVAAYVLHSRGARWSGLVLLCTTYVVAHVFVLGVQLLPALAVIAGLMAYVEVRILAERFAPLFLAPITPGQRRQFSRALLRGLVRLAAALMVSFVVPLFAADLAVAGVLPLTTIPTALLLAAGLVAVVVMIALLPTFDTKVNERRGALRQAQDPGSLR
jgi:hypothetical protein